MIAAETNQNLNAWATRLNVLPTRDQRELRGRVERALAAHFRAPALRCERCGFTSPDVPDVVSCPGCGVAFADGGEMQTNVVPMGSAARTARSKKPAETEVAEQTEPVKEKAQRALKPDAKSPEKVAEKQVAKKLADLETKIDSLREKSGHIEWDIGAALNEIYQHDYWQAASDAKGNCYKTFNDYATSRFGVTRQTIHVYMAVSDKFTREEAATIPLGHLKLLVSVPDDSDREALAEMVREREPTFRELAAVVKAKRAEAGLNTSRASYENTTLVTVRLKTGEVAAEGYWSEVKAKDGKKRRVGSFEFGGHTFSVEDLGTDGLIVRLVPPG